MREWDGTREINSDRLVKVQWRCGDVSKQSYKASQIRWKWGAEPHDYDVVAFEEVSA